MDVGIAVFEIQSQQSNRIDTEACTKARCNTWVKNKGRNASQNTICAVFLAIEIPLQEHITCSYVPTLSKNVKQEGNRRRRS